MKLKYQHTESREAEIPTSKIIEQIMKEYLNKLGGEFISIEQGKMILMAEYYTSHRFDSPVRVLTPEEIANIKALENLIKVFAK
jgi:hypothetical protein